MNEARRVIILGDSMLDQRTLVDTERFSPEDSSVVVYREHSSEFYLGGAANVAHNVSAMGGEVLLLTGSAHTAGNGGPSLSSLAGTLMPKCVVRFTPDVQASPLKHRIVHRQSERQLFRLDREFPPETYGTSNVWDADGLFSCQLRMASDEPSKNLLVVSDYDKGFFHSLTAPSRITDTVKAAEENMMVGDTLPLLVDPGRNGQWLRFGSDQTLFKANVAQCQQLFNLSNSWLATSGMPENLRLGKSPNTDDVDALTLNVDKALRMMWPRKSPYAYLVITLGASGLVLRDYDTGRFNWFCVDNYQGAPVVDVCGAGDTVLAALAYKLSRPNSDFCSRQHVVEACQFANRAANYAVRRPGTYAVGKDLP